MKRKLLYFLRMYLGFSRRESRGFLLVVPMLVLLYLIPIVHTRLTTNAFKDDYTHYLKEVELLRAQQAAGSDTLNPFRKQNADVDKRQDTPVRFKAYKKPPEPAISSVDFSDADSIVLQVVPGIGEVLAGRIIKYRESLGGLHRKQQLLEVYGITEEVADRIFEYFSFTPSIRKKININELDAGGLADHPYISYGHAKVIVAYRKQHGNYNSAGDLLKIKIFNEEWLDRLRPYLAF